MTKKQILNLWMDASAMPALQPDWNKVSCDLITHICIIMYVLPYLHQPCHCTFWSGQQGLIAQATSPKGQAIKNSKWISKCEFRSLFTAIAASNLLFIHPCNSHLYKEVYSGHKSKKAKADKQKSPHRSIQLQYKSDSFEFGKSNHRL